MNCVENLFTYNVTLTLGWPKKMKIWNYHVAPFETVPIVCQ